MTLTTCKSPLPEEKHQRFLTYAWFEKIDCLITGNTSGKPVQTKIHLTFI
jgi:hypothetical protein